MLPVGHSVMKRLTNPRSARGGEYSTQDFFLLFIVEPDTRAIRISPPTPSCRLQVQLRRKRHARSNLSIIAPELIATLCTSARHLQKWTDPLVRTSYRAIKRWISYRGIISIYVHNPGESTGSVLRFASNPSTILFTPLLPPPCPQYSTRTALPRSILPSPASYPPLFTCLVTSSIAH